MNRSRLGANAGTRRRLLAVFASAVAVGMWSKGTWAQTSGFDHSHSAWNVLLQKHVRWLPDGKQSRVDYKSFAANRAALKEVLQAFSAVPKAAFDGWSAPQQMAFLINAYNAFTVELVLNAYPQLQSIKDLGSLFQSPWKKKFFSLLGEPRHLDWIEHEQLRPNYNEPRVHAAVNCASIGCPALRDEAFTAAKLPAQLEDGMRRFLGDRNRNRVAKGQLEVNEIFKWFREDFEKGHQGFHRLEDVFARYAEQLSDLTTEQTALRARQLPVRFLDYDWSLNDLGR
ncbi:DUF547 domain-containing protein [Hydrogenophaga sp.]|uniref:DUF547 domain-containing protein n=1 Tax=Hydrogenophaga sp. TaxID=1904254 RepID=UPI0035672D7A